MTAPFPTVNTVPFCGACGWDVTNNNLNDDELCDSCGADLIAFGFGDLLPPTALEAVSGVGEVTFIWTDNPGADTTESRSRLNDETFSAWATDTSPTTVVAGVTGDKIHFQVRSIDNAISGPSRQITGTVL